MSDSGIMQELFEALVDDVIYISDLLISNNNQTNRRLYVRSVFALLEGEISERKKIALARHTNASPIFSDDEISLLMEHDTFLDNAGRAKVRSMHLPLSANLQFSLHVIAKAYSIEFNIDKSHGWESVLKAIKIRHRITHPKSNADIRISDEDMKIVDDALDWYKEIWGNLISQIDATR